MAATPLGPPPPIVSTGTLDITTLSPASLWRISSHATGEPYFGASGGNRFDAPGCVSGYPEFYGCYLGVGLHVAFAESVLHDAMPTAGLFGVASTTLANAYVHRFSGRTLHLADLTGVALKRLGGNADLAGTDYDMCQAWSLAIHANPAGVDGFKYMSRHLNTESAVFLFDRARHKLAAKSPQALTAQPQFLQLLSDFRVIPA